MLSQFVFVLKTPKLRGGLRMLDVLCCSLHCAVEPLTPWLGGRLS